MEHEAPGTQSGGSPDEDRRVELILARARREVAAQDVITFIAARAWSAVSVLGSILAALLGSRTRRDDAEPPTRDREER